MFECQKKRIFEYYDYLNQEIKSTHNVEELQDVINKIYFYTKGLLAGFKVGNKLNEELKKND